MNKYRFTAPCHFGLEKTLEFEVKKIGGEDISVSDGRVSFSGTAETCAKANVFLSTAERVYIVLGEFRAENYDDIFAGIEKLPLSEFIGKNDAFPNNGHSINSILTSIPACQKRVKLAMARNLGKAYGLERMPETGNECKIRFSIMKNIFSLYLDTSGEGLHKRGYRAISNAAPIRETLAAGIIDLARVREGDLVCDPFCGSGTILIESAFKALNIAPGLKRRFAGEHLGFIPKSAWRNAREEARSFIKNDADFCAVGFDIDPECVRLTLENAEKAGVSRCISASVRDIRDFSYPDKPTKIITNPPYGERLLEQEQAREIYKIMGEKLISFGDNQLYAITSDDEFERLFGKKSDKNRKLYNGMLKARLYSYRHI
ncbi:MAG: class I SAM-dependent RNA methyltransferase [Oscillospiraceae bacterium]|nr:class I SAM-dependent RNA methyltransferase [Oscillospiraceae bacterium]